MDFAVYDGQNRNASMMVVVALIAGMLAAFTTFLLLQRRQPNVPTGYYAFLFPFAMILVLVLLISVTTSVRIRIARATGEIIRLHALFGHEVRRQPFKLSDFDRVSLTRSFRTGYRVSLLGHEQDMLVFATNNLRTARERADEIAAACGLKVSDQL